MALEVDGPESQIVITSAVEEDGPGSLLSIPALEVDGPWSLTFTVPALDVDVPGLLVLLIGALEVDDPLAMKSAILSLLAFTSENGSMDAFLLNPLTENEMVTHKM